MKVTRRRELSMMTMPSTSCWIGARLEKIVEMKTCWPTNISPSSRSVVRVGERGGVSWLSDESRVASGLVEWKRVLWLAGCQSLL